MNYSTAVFLINDSVRAVFATYEEGENAARTMFKTFDETIKVDDYVVVPTNTRHKMTICKIVEVDIEPDFDSTLAIDWIIGKVNTAAYEGVLKQEGDLIETAKAAEKRKKREAMKESLMAYQTEQMKSLPIYQQEDK